MKKILFCFTVFALQFGCMGTNTGNPGAVFSPVLGTSTFTAGLVATVCTQIVKCYAGANLSTCETQVFSLTGYPNQLGVNASTHSTMTALQTAEQAGATSANSNNVQACETAISHLNCTDSLISQSYSNSSPNDYANTNLLFKVSASCQSIF